LKHDLGIADTTNQDLRVYGAAIALMLVILTAGIILLLRDISREARSNRLKSDFVSGVSHELKTPITLIRLYSETLLRGTAATTEERNDFCRIIMRESDRLGRMVDRVLTFSRVERGAQAYKFEEGDVAPVVERIVEDYFGYFELSGFRLERRLATSLPKVRFDAAALSQAIVNLMENALKYSGESRDITVSLKSNGRLVTFEVEDHGLGVPVEEQKRIFERFYRVPNGDGQGGYGLGLFLVQHIMTAHGGFAEVESQPGKGSTFRLNLPTVAQ
jgi:two-component system phosphate regulon sensor histidine kinase PhoR